LGGSSADGHRAAIRGRTQGKAAALEAIALDGDSADAHEALAIVRTWIDWDWVGAEPEWRRALEINPNAANAHAYFAHYLAIVGRVEDLRPTGIKP